MATSFLSRRWLPQAAFLLCLTYQGGAGAQEPIDERAVESRSEVFRAADWRGGSDVAFEGCTANSGEYTLWVYATREKCGVPREQAERVVMFRQPLPGVSPLRATSHLPEGRYAVWVFGAGDPGHPWINLCAKTCVKGALPKEPGWVSLGWIEVRTRHLMWLKTWEQPDGHQLFVQAVVLSSDDVRPEWSP
ncbi:hypothetical protein [Nitrospira moscoviensis]|uniref:Lipoprotein n=1 Tax=Nitrospira moscoviensis TaxID=42253 RepID=A0A0K2GCV6_NITMO|nr:hypothetical protein [Nitrospira moscoviensis]ALA58412.1 exported protein of unknown function [Nitrospira moscoviensis]